MQTRDRLIASSRLVVRVATAVNRLFMLAVSLALLLSWLLSAQVGTFLTQSDPSVDSASELAGLRFEMLVGIIMAVATERLLANLGNIIASAEIGDPFNVANAGRLHAIGWALLLLQVLDIPTAILSRVYPSLGTASPLAGFSAGGWVAVLMVFVLSRVFARGAVMREELDGTI